MTFVMPLQPFFIFWIKVRIDQDLSKPQKERSPSLFPDPEIGREFLRLSGSPIAVAGLHPSKKQQGYRKPSPGGPRGMVCKDSPLLRGGRFQSARLESVPGFTGNFPGSRRPS